MSDTIRVRWGWLKFMYGYTIFGAGCLGAAILLAPESIRTLLKWPANEPISLGIVGSVYACFGVLSLFGLRDPLRFAPLLVLQLFYKTLWFIAVAGPLLWSGRFHGPAVLFAVIFLSYIVGDLIAIPFALVFTARERSGNAEAARPTTGV